MARIYKTELDKDTFFSKLENYRKKEALAKPIKGWLENEKGLLKEGGRYGTKFSVRFVDEKQLK